MTDSHKRRADSTSTNFSVSQDSRKSDC